jgi:hypothetical protein
MFYRVKPNCKTQTSASGKIVAQHAQSDDGWIRAGFVSKYSPFGHGTEGMGYRPDELEPAKPEEVLQAIRKQHPHGRFFLPTSHAALDQGFHGIMSSAIRNWSELSRPPQAQAIKQETDIIDHWASVALKQRQILEKQYGQHQEGFVSFITACGMNRLSRGINNLIDKI